MDELDYEISNVEIVPSKLDKAIEIVSKTENLVNTVSNTFSSAFFNPMINMMIENRNTFARIQNEIALRRLEGIETREFIQQKYEIEKSTLEEINKNINSSFEELKKFDVNTMNEKQTKMYEMIFNGKAIKYGDNVVICPMYFSTVERCLGKKFRTYCYRFCHESVF